MGELGGTFGGTRNANYSKNVVLSTLKLNFSFQKHLSRRAGDKPSSENSAPTRLHSFDSPEINFPSSDRVFAQKIKVASKLRTKNGIREQFSVTSRRLRSTLELSPAAFQNCLRNFHVDAPLFYAQFDFIPGANQT